jgi:hypothetical protein
MLPASLTEGATEKQMKGSLFNIAITGNTAVVVAFQSVSFPF